MPIDSQRVKSIQPSIGFHCQCCAKTEVLHKGQGYVASKHAAIPTRSGAVLKSNCNSSHTNTENVLYRSLNEPLILINQLTCKSIQITALQIE